MDQDSYYALHIVQFMAGFPLSSDRQLLFFLKVILTSKFLLDLFCQYHFYIFDETIFQYQFSSHFSQLSSIISSNKFTDDGILLAMATISL
jgi:hypothetical protein